MLGIIYVSNYNMSYTYLIMYRLQFDYMLFHLVIFLIEIHSQKYEQPTTYVLGKMFLIAYQLPSIAMLLKRLLVMICTFEAVKEL